MTNPESCHADLTERQNFATSSDSSFCFFSARSLRQSWNGGTTRGEPISAGHEITEKLEELFEYASFWWEHFNDWKRCLPDSPV